MEPRLLHEPTGGEDEVDAPDHGNVRYYIGRALSATRLTVVGPPDRQGE